MIPSVQEIERETRLPIFRRWAKELKVKFDDVNNVPQARELLMAAIKAPVSAKPQPPVAKQPVASKPPTAIPKPAATPTKAAPPIAAAMPAKSPAMPAAKSAPSAAKPAPAAASKALAPPPAEYVLVSVFQEYAASVEETVAELSNRVVALELRAAGYGAHVSVGENGEIVLDVENADEETLRDWSYQFGQGDMLAADVETIRKAFLKARNAKNFAGWEVVNKLPRPAAEEAPAAPPAEEESGAASEKEVPEEGTTEEGEEVTEEQIEAMSITELTEFAGKYGIDVSDITGKPEKLRPRILAILSAMQIPEGTPVTASHGGTEYMGTYAGMDDTHQVLVDIPEGGGADPGQYTFPAASVTVTE